MLNSYNKEDTLQNFLGFDDGKELKKNYPYIPDQELSIFQKYDNFFLDTVVNVEEANDNFEMAHTELKDKIVNSYNEIAANISSGMNISKNVIKASGILIISIGAWKLIGKDVYYIAKGK